MIERHTVDSWDETLDRRLRDALAVEPSIAFRSKVRARLDAEPIPSRFAGTVTSLAAAAATIAVVVLAGTIGGRWWNAEPALLRVMSPPGAAAVPFAAPVAPRTVGVVTGPDGGRVAVRATTVAADASEVPMVAQFAPEERAAFGLFVRLARAGALPVPELLPLANGADALPAIEIPPIEIPPVIADAGEGVMP